MERARDDHALVERRGQAIGPREAGRQEDGQAVARVFPEGGLTQQRARGLQDRVAIGVAKCDALQLVVCTPNQVLQPDGVLLLVTTRTMRRHVQGNAGTLSLGEQNVELFLTECHRHAPSRPMREAMRPAYEIGSFVVLEGRQTEDRGPLRQQPEWTGSRRPGNAGIRVPGLSGRVVFVHRSGWSQGTGGRIPLPRGAAMPRFLVLLLLALALPAWADEPAPGKGGASAASAPGYRAQDRVHYATSRSQRTETPPDSGECCVEGDRAGVRLRSGRGGRGRASCLMVTDGAVVALYPGGCANETMEGARMLREWLAPYGAARRRIAAAFGGPSPQTSSTRLPELHFEEVGERAAAAGAPRPGDGLHAALAGRRGVGGAGDRTAEEAEDRGGARRRTTRADRPGRRHAASWESRNPQTKGTGQGPRRSRPSRWRPGGS